MIKKFIMVLLAAPVMFMLSSCAANPAKVFVKVTSEKPVYKIGQTMAVALTILNTDSTPLTVTFPSAQKYDFYLYSNGKLIWKWSQDKMFSQSISNLTLAPQEPVTYVITFIPVSPSGEMLKPGQYQLKGALLTQKVEYTSEPLEIQIRK